MNPYLASFLKSVILSAVTVGSTALSHSPYGAIVTPFAAMILKYLGDK